MNAQESPIFIVGSSRSGTTLVSACLRRHPHIHITNETHYFDDLRLKLMRRLSGDPEYDFRSEAIQYFRRLDAGLYALEGEIRDGRLSADALDDQARLCGIGPDAYFEAFCICQAEQKGRIRWGEKTPRHVYQLDVILKRFPQAKIIFMVRDPRAVAASYRYWRYEGPKALADPAALAPERRRAVRSYHSLILAMMWRSGVRTALAARARYGVQRVVLVRYEDLVTRPEPTLERLCEFLEEDFTADMLDVPAVNSSFTGFNRAGGISPLSVERWRDSLSVSEIAAIQYCCRKEMKEFAYERIPLGLSGLSAARQWVTLPYVASRAVLVNRSRIGSLPAYLWRRFRGAPLAESMSHA